MLKLKQLRFSYTQTDGLNSGGMCFDLEVEGGEILSLIGPSGSGKSTLLNLIAGFIQPSAGEILVKDRNIGSLSPAERPVTIVFQEHNLFPHLDVFTNVALGINPSLKLTQEQRSAVNAGLHKMGLGGMEKRKPGQLSGGQRQRVALARALVREHEILLLDEPFTALGPALRKEMIELVRELVERQGMAALLVSHQPQDAELASKRTAFINNGEVAQVDETRKLLTESHLPEVMEYL
ncbi:MAG: thiamine ABC transporter ATP-binding protein [Sedimenticola sp.]